MNEQVKPLSSAADAGEVLFDLMERMTERVQLGGEVDVEAYIREYPEHAEQLRKMSLTLEVLRDLARSTSGAAEAADPGHALAPGGTAPVRTLGDYRILREIGRGGMGVVYEAEQVSLGRKVALKVLPFAAMLDKRQLQRFQNEARAAASLKHPNIVQVYSVGCERAVHFYAMEYVEGQTLAEVIHHLRWMEGLEGETPDHAAGAANLAESLGSGRFRPPQTGSDLQAPTAARIEAQTPGVAAETKRTPQAAISTERSAKSPAYFRSVAEIGAAVAEALDHAHQNGVIHRDVKPSNVILDSQGKPWVTDFGLARIESDASLTLSGDLLGTVRYMSPEQALARRIVVDHRTDVYSLGATLYELATLQPAFSGQDRQDLLRQIAFEEPKPPRKLSKAVPEELEIIVAKAMAKNSAERYDTAQDLADDLRRFLEDCPIRARRPTLVQRAAKWSRRHRPIVWSAAVSTFLLLILGLVGLGIGNIMISGERDKKDVALRAKMDALGQRNQALLSAESERRRAEENLDLALAALDAVYLDAIGRDKLLGDPVSQADELEDSESDPPPPSTRWELEPPPLTDLERELLKRGLKFYDQFAQKNTAAPRAIVQTAQAYYRVGLLQGALGDTVAAAEAQRGAIERFHRLAAEEPGNAEHFRRLAEAYRALGTIVPQWDAAKRLFEDGRRAYSRAIDLKPNDITLYLGRGAMSGDSEALEDYMRALQLDPDNVEVLLKCTFSHLYAAPVSKDRKEARVYAERAVALAPDNFRCHVALADVLSRVNSEVVVNPGSGSGVFAVPDQASALAEYARAIELAPLAPEPYLARGAFYHSVGDYDRGLADVNRALELRPGDHESLALRADVLIELGQFDKALADLAKYTEADPHKWRAHKAAATIHVRRGNWQLAVESYTKALEIAPSQAHLLKHRALAHVNLGQHSQALADLNTALTLHPWDISTLWWIPEPQLAQSPDDFKQGLVALAEIAVEESPVPAKAYAARGRVYARLGEFEKADADFAMAVELDPKEAYGWSEWGLSLGRRRMYLEAREKYSRAIEAKPDHWLYRWNRGVANQHLGDLQGVVEDFGQVLVLHPAHKDALVNRYAAYFRLGDYDNALADLETALRLHPADSSVLEKIPAKELAHSPNEFQNRYFELVSALAHERPDDWVAWNRRGLANMAFSRWEDALGDFSKAIELKQDEAAPWSHRGSCRRKQGQWAEAAADLAQAILLGDNGYLTWSRLAQCHLALGNTQEYENACRGMAEQLPEPNQRNIADWGHIGQALYHAGRYGEARAALEKVIALRGDHGPTMDFGPRWWYYTMSLHRLGESDRAGAYYDELVEIMERNPPGNKDLYDRLRTEAAKLLGKEVEAGAGQEEPTQAKKQEDEN